MRVMPLASTASGRRDRRRTANSSQPTLSQPKARVADGYYAVADFVSCLVLDHHGSPSRGSCPRIEKNFLDMETFWPVDGLIHWTAEIVWEGSPLLCALMAAGAAS